MRVAVSQNVAVVGWGPAVNPLCHNVCVKRACVHTSTVCKSLSMSTGIRASIGAMPMKDLFARSELMMP